MRLGKSLERARKKREKQEERHEKVREGERYEKIVRDRYECERKIEIINFLIENKNSIY